MSARVADLALAEPILAWSQATASGEEAGLAWADPSLDLDARPLSARAQGRTRVVFQAGPVTANIPPTVGLEAWGAQAAGEATAWEGLQLVFARPRWVVAGRGQLWGSASPEPRVLASLVEACGVERPVHRGDRDRLRRLAALMPSWRPYRGTAERAGEVLEAAGLGEQMSGVIRQNSHADAEEETAPSATAGEIFACHGASWWLMRRAEDARGALRISGSLLRFQPRMGEAFLVRREDVLTETQTDRPLPRDLYRLLPVWATVRAVSTTAAPAATPDRSQA